MTDRDFDELIASLGRPARAAAAGLARADRQLRDHALNAAAQCLRERVQAIVKANAVDMAAASQRGLAGPVLDRLLLDPARLEQVAAGLEAIAALPDPLGQVQANWTRPNGLRIERVSVGLGVIGVIFESRPNVTVDAAALCLKSGNAVILRGGSEAVHSNRALHEAFVSGLRQAGLNSACVQLLPTQERDAVGALLRARPWLDLVIPRGGRGLVERVQSDARVPILAHLDGNNHLYVHHSADPAMAGKVVTNSKLRRPGICGALETLLIDRAWLSHAPKLFAALIAKGCELRGDATACRLDRRVRPAAEDDWAAEYLAPILAVRVVEGPEQALGHVRRYGSGHTDGLIAADPVVAADFLTRLDSAIAVHNASTQFADGGEFGFGAEIGIATGRLHARGPVGLEQLTTYQYRLHGSGQTRP